MAVKTQTKKLTSLEENLAFLRKILSVDTLLDEINQEEALEFLEAVENGISETASKHQEDIEDLNEKLDNPKWIDVLQKIRDTIDDEKAVELLEIVKDQDKDIVYDAVRGEGFFYVKINSMVDEEKLRNFIEREIYPSYNEQQTYIL